MTRLVLFLVGLGLGIAAAIAWREDEQGLPNYEPEAADWGGW